MFYSKSTGGFYTREIHGDNIPTDAVEITDEYHAELMDGQSAGKIIDWSGSTPVLTDIPLPSNEELASIARSNRDAMLAASDWTQVADAPVDQTSWHTYRQALRDVPDQVGFPFDIGWPVAPQ